MDKPTPPPADILETVVRLPSEPGYYLVCSVGSSSSREYSHVLRVLKWDQERMTDHKNGAWDKDLRWGKNAHVVLGPCQTEQEASQALERQATTIAEVLPDAVVDIDSLGLDYLPLLIWATKTGLRIISRMC